METFSGDKAPLLRFDGVCKDYGKKTALKDVSFVIGEGEVVGLLGRNGAGKSTLMNVLTGYLPASAGKVFIRGIDMEQEPRKAKRYIGYLPEQPPLYDFMTVREYLRFVGKIKQLPPAELDDEVYRVCGEVGITEVGNRLVRNLSKGYRQRIGVAQAMLSRPDLLVLDEPTAGLDPRQIVEIRALIHNFSKRHAVLVSSHILSEIAEICSRTLIIHGGRLVKDGDVGELGGTDGGVERLRIRVTGSQKDAREILEGLQGTRSFHCIGAEEAGSTDWEIEYPRKNSSLRHALFDAIVKADRKLLLSRPCETNIEDAFLELTADDR
ncbi:ABC transporter ATP-binding protein [Spirochaetia bacterium]|nr:ABC transporter ATP-binding protein [Spirochaetia bacterium]